jgi:quercetin dioxygenase-like cupin family protein
MFRSALTACAALAVVAFANGSVAQERPAAVPNPIDSIKRIPLQRFDLPGTSYETVIGIAEIAPNVSIGRHTHPGPESGYLIEGSFELLIEGESPRLLKAGESYVVPSRAVHDAKSGPEGARVIATYVVEKGRPLASPAKWGARSAGPTYAVKQGLVETNVALGVGTNNELSRDRALNDDEIRRVWAGLDDSKTIGMARATVLLLKLILTAGQRGKELRVLRWSDVDLAKRMFTIPATAAKSRREHAVPLNDRATLLLRELQRLGDGSAWLFPSTRGEQPMQEAAQSKAVRRAIGLESRKARSASAVNGVPRRERTNPVVAVAKQSPLHGMKPSTTVL